VPPADFVFELGAAPLQHRLYEIEINYRGAAPTTPWAVPNREIEINYRGAAPTTPWAVPNREIEINYKRKEKRINPFLIGALPLRPRGLCPTERLK